MYKVKSKFRERIYDYIKVQPDGVVLSDNRGVVLTVHNDLKKPNSLYKLHDIDKAVYLYATEFPRGILPLDRMLETQELHHLFALDKSSGKTVYAKTSLHSNFGRFNRSLLPTSEDIIFIVKDTKNIIACVNGKYKALLKSGIITEVARTELATKDFDLLKKLCNELSKVDKVESILTKIL